MTLLLWIISVLIAGGVPTYFWIKVSQSNIEYRRWADYFKKKREEESKNVRDQARAIRKLTIEVEKERQKALNANNKIRKCIKDKEHIGNVLHSLSIQAHCKECGQFIPVNPEEIFEDEVPVFCDKHKPCQNTQ